MSDNTAKRCLAICPLFEAELLLELMLINWGHPFSNEESYRQELLESTTEVLMAASNDSCTDVFIEGLPTKEMNFVSAVWYVEWCVSRTIIETAICTRMAEGHSPIASILLLPDGPVGVLELHRPKKLILTFDDLPLQEAIKKLFEDAEFVRSESLLITDVGREWVLQKVISSLPKDLIGHFRFEHILLSVNQFRKLNQDHIQKRLIILEHARNMRKPRCFYGGKVGTPCSEEIDLDRVKPGKRGGDYTVDNTVLSCSKHNRQRGCKEVLSIGNNEAPYA